MAIDPGQGTAQLPEGLGADQPQPGRAETRTLHHGKAGSAIAASPAGAKARRVCTPWAGTQPCRRGQQSVPQQQSQLPLHPRPSPVLGIRGWRKPAVSTAPLIAPLGNSHRTLKVRQLQRAAPCPPNTLCLERARGGTAPKCNQEAPATAKTPAHRTSHLRTPQRPAFGHQPPHRHNTTGTKQRASSKALHGKGSAGKTGESPRNKRALGSGNQTECT